MQILNGLLDVDVAMVSHFVQTEFVKLWVCQTN